MFKVKFFTALIAAMLVAATNAADIDKASQENAADVADLWVQSQKGGYTVEFVNNGDVAGVQFDLRDRRISEGGFTCGTQALQETHEVVCNLHEDDGFLRVLVFAMPTAVIPDSTVVEVSPEASVLRVAAQPSVELAEVTLADAEAQDVTPGHLRADEAKDSAK